MTKITLSLEDLEQMCNLPRRTHFRRPAFDACLGQKVNHDNTLKTVVAIAYEVAPNRVEATLR